MNPFIELARDPVGVLSAIGYALALLTLLVLTVGACWTNAAKVRAQYQANRSRWGYLPPASWLLRVAAIPGILAVDAWALSALAWLIAA
jgi:hypothetical protein